VTVELPQVEVQSLFSHGIDFYERRIYLTGAITEEVSSNLVRSLHLMSRISDPIEIVVQSYGGDLCAMFAIYDAIQIINSEASPIHTVGTGEVSSAALIILSCGRTRSATKNTYAMAHTASSDVQENYAHTVLSGARATDDMNQRMWELLAQHTFLSAKQWSDEAKNLGEVWMTADELKERGVIDDIIEPKCPPKKPVRPRSKSAATVKKSKRAKTSGVRKR